MIKPSVDYRQFRFSKLNTCAYPNRELNEYRSVFDKMLFRGR